MAIIRWTMPTSSVVDFMSFYGGIITFQGSKNGVVLPNFSFSKILGISLGSRV